MKWGILFFLTSVQLLTAAAWQTVTGTRRITLWQNPDYFVQSQLQQDGINAGVYHDGDTLAFGEGRYSETFMEMQAGHLTRSLDSGFLLANGGWLPQFASLATERPLGARLALRGGEIFSASGAYYELPSEASRLGMVETSVAIPGIWLLAFGWLQTSLVDETYFLRTDLQLAENFNAGLTVRQNRDWQAEVYWRLHTARVSLLAFERTVPHAFQAGIYRRYSQAAQLLFDHENVNLRHLESREERRTIGRVRFSNTGFFHLEHEQRTSLSGVFYENPREGFHLLFHGYQSRIDRSWQAAVGCNYGKLAKIAWVTGVAERYHPVDPVFWPAFSDINNMREDNLLYFRGRLQALEAAVETRGFSFYGLLFQNNDRQSAQKLEALFRVGFSYVIGAN